MSVLARLWDRVSGSQPLPPAWVIALAYVGEGFAVGIFVTM